MPESQPIRVGVLTVSDRASRGERPDESGPRLRARCEAQGWQMVRAEVVPDEQPVIEARLRAWADSGEVDLILTTGGTGFAPRDRTPEATLAVVERLAPGLAEVMRLRSLEKTPYAMLSRSVAGIRGRTIILNLPGSPKAAVENLEAVLPALPHGVDILREAPGAEAGHRPPKPRQRA